MFKQKAFTKLIILILAFSSLAANFYVPNTASSATISELEKKAEEYRKSIAQKQTEAQKKKQDATLLNKAITQIDGDINSTESKIDEAQGKIAQTQGSIADAQKQIEEKEKELAHQRDLQAEAIRMIYIYGEEDPLDILLSEKSISAVVEQNNYLESLEAKIEATISEVDSLKKELEKKKSDLENQKNDLELYKSQQESSKRQLDSQKNQKSKLLSSTNAQINDFLSDISEMQKKVAEIQRQIDTLIATRSWGGDIVSSNDSSWYYSQLNYQNKMGNSPYTVAQYGCYVTSIAMVATYHGRKISPADIASDTSLFTKEGYFLNQFPSYLGVNSIGKSSVNWGVVNDDISNGYPVIISLYMPQVGALNQDGSSHFVVIKGFSNGKYLMHDPLGAGRGYSISQVRSMVRLRPN